jgi:hypothetical protein
MLFGLATTSAFMVVDRIRAHSLNMSENENGAERNDATVTSSTNGAAPNAVANDANGEGDDTKASTTATPKRKQSIATPSTSTSTRGANGSGDDGAKGLAADARHIDQISLQSAQFPWYAYLLTITYSAPTDHTIMAKQMM